MKVAERLKHKINWRRLLIALTALAILVILITNIPGIYDFFVYSDFETVEGLVGSDYKLAGYDDGVIAYNNRNMNFINKHGEVEWSVNVSTTSPGAYIKEDYILLADLGGTNAYLYDGERLRTKFTVKNEITAAAVDDKGNTAIAAKEQGSKGTVTVYDKDGEKQYVFKSGEGYVGALAIRRKQFAISQIIVDEKAVSSKIVIVNWSKNKESVCEERNDEMVFDIKFSDDGKIIAVSEKNLLCYSESGTAKFSVSFGGRSLLKYNTESDDNMVFCFDGDQNNSVVESYSKSGELRGTYIENGDVSDVDAEGETVLINSMRKLERITPDGKLKKSVVSVHDVKKIKLFPDRSHALVTGNSQATVVKIK